jgi:hypothetical protein
MTIEPVPEADRGAAASGGRREAARAGTGGNTLRVAAVNGAFCRSERRVRFVTVLSFLVT